MGERADPSSLHGTTPLAPDWVPPRVDTSRPHPARIYDYYLGGHDNFPADRLAGDQALAAMPTVATAARENRAFLTRVISYLVRKAGIRQFIDIGTGIPTVGSVHETAQRLVPASRVLYVDNDPIVLVHARAALTSTPAGRTAYLHADLRDPEKIQRAAAELLDLTRPIALLMLAILHFVPDEWRPVDAVGALLGDMSGGSHLVVSHLSAEWAPERVARLVNAYRDNGLPCVARSGERMAADFFTGLDLVDPGIVPIAEWCPTDDTRALPARQDIPLIAGVARVP